MSINEKCIELKKIDIGEMKSYSNILIIGKRGTGKTYLTTDILFHINKNIPKGCIMSATDSRHYANIIPPPCNYDEYNSNIIEKITKDKFETNKNICSINNNNDNNDNDTNSFLVLDNCLNDYDWRAKYLRFLLMNSKNFKHTMIVTQSHPYGLSGLTPKIRENFDYIFLLRERNEQIRNKIYKSIVGNLALSFESFCQIMNQCTENYECLVIDNTSVSYNIQKNIFWYKASEHKDFYINCE
jgi:Cdc6-like AAA superfamily ATPase